MMEDSRRAGSVVVMMVVAMMLWTMMEVWVWVNVNLDAARD